eukprot:01986.XXX_29950_29107_1 [CDS] Oithona nana genome sequencing.
MVKNDNTKLASTSKTAPINGILNSIWSKSLVELNNTPINSNTDFHYMKYFFTSLIDSTRGQTIGPKSGEGYYWDDASLLESRSSPSFTKRSNLFKKNNDYTTDEVCFAGILYHDLITCKTGIPPGVEVRITLTKNKDSVAIHTFDTSTSSSTVDYKLKITRAHLHVEVAQMTTEIFNDYEAKLARSVATLRFRRWVTRAINVQSATGM